jgi:beta-lactamase superfamily II metal-dependent hydrolase
MYRVGFGDFFLVTVPTDDGPKHILIDCGVTPGTTHNGDIGTIKAAVTHMTEETNKKLALIIVTHRHMDHIIGFSRCPEFQKDFTVESIWMPYWESEYDEAVKFQADLTELATDMQHYLAFSADKNTETNELLGMLRNATGLEDDELFAVAGTTPGKGGGTNAKSLAMLKNGFGVKPEYYKKGDNPKLPKSLENSGLEAVILGPPPPDAMDFMKLNDLKKGVGQYLGADGGSTTQSKIFEPFGKMWQTDASAYPESAFREYAPRVEDPNAKPAHEKLEAVINAAQPAILLTAVKELEHSLNNQSLVVLFTFKGKRLLFVGDAQAGNWTYWMYGGTPTKAPSLDDLSAEGKSVLGNLDFYKVGHHGSTNATPITAVDAMGGTFASMCSTQADTYGNPDKGTEVPRDPLLAALAKKSALVRSDSPDAQGKFDVTDLYVDYEM